MASTFRTTRRVEFADTDMAGIAHFANFFRWMEEVEHEFVRSLGGSVHESGGDRGHFGFVRAHASCDYRAPAKYQQVLDVRLTVEKKTSKALHYGFEFFEPKDAKPRGDATVGRSLANGRLEVVCVTRDDDSGALRAIEIPNHLAAQLEAAPRDPLGSEQP